MQPIERRTRRPVRWLWMLAIVMPVVCVWGGEFLCCILTHRTHVIPQVTDVLMTQSAMVAAPFCFVAAWGTRRAAGADESCRSFLWASVRGVVSTLLIWGAYHYDGYVYWAQRKDSGVPMGGVCLMLLSPVAVAALMLAAWWLFAPSRSARAE